jgi:hypothetical protein
MLYGPAMPLRISRGAEVTANQTIAQIISLLQCMSPEVALLYGPAVCCKLDVTDLKMTGLALLYSALSAERRDPLLILPGEYAYSIITLRLVLWVFRSCALAAER